MTQLWDFALRIRAAIGSHSAHVSRMPTHTARSNTVALSVQSVWMPAFNQLLHVASMYLSHSRSQLLGIVGLLILHRHLESSRDKMHCSVASKTFCGTKVTTPACLPRLVCVCWPSFPTGGWLKNA